MIESWLGPVCATMSSVTWAAGSSVYSKVSEKHSAFSVNFTRAVIALILFLVAHLIVSGGFGPAWNSIVALRIENVAWMALSILSCYVLGDVFFLWSTHTLGVPGGLAIASCYPIWTALVGWLVEGQRMGAVRWLGLMISLAGIIVVILNAPKAHQIDRKLEPGGKKKWVGVLFAVLASIGWASNTYAVSKGSQGISIEIGNSIRMFFGLLLIPVAAKLLAKGSRLTIPFKDIRPVAWLFAFESFGGSYFFVLGLQKSPLVIASTLASLAPVLAVPVGWVMKTEKFSLPRTLGVVAVVVGLALLMGG